jgi:hypothetical protein
VSSERRRGTRSHPHAACDPHVNPARCAQGPYHHPREAVWRRPSFVSAVPHNGHASASQTLRVGIAALMGSRSVSSWSTTSTKDAALRKRYSRAPQGTAGHEMIVPRGYGSGAAEGGSITLCLYLSTTTEARVLLFCSGFCSREACHTRGSSRGQHKTARGSGHDLAQ